MKRAALHNLGCKVNAYETQAMQQMLEEAGYQIVPFQEKADVYVINTCSVTNIADRKSRQMLHRAKRLNPDAVIVAAGCYVQAQGPQMQTEGIADIILGNNKKKHLISMLQEYEKEAGKYAQYEKEGRNTDSSQGRHAVTAWEDINDGKKQYECLKITQTAEHTRAFIKIQDGCSQFCSYCIIPYTRGRVRSRKAEDILNEIKILAKKGCRETVLTGIHISSYGTDFGFAQGEGLLRLLGQIQQIEGIRRIRLGSLEPGIITESFASQLAGMDKICPHFHLSLQSGCDSVLKRMNRKYTTAEYAMRCEILRKLFDNPAITTDVITGFPGETEEEFQTTRQFLEKIQFYEMHIFKYSKRQGTKAAAMDGQITEAVKAARSAQLLLLEEQMSARYREGFTGRTAEALLEEPFVYNGKEYMSGYTKEYVKIAAETGKNRANTFIRGKITGHLTGDIYLMVEF